MTRPEEITGPFRILFPKTLRGRIVLHCLFWFGFVTYHLMYFYPISKSVSLPNNVVWAYSFYYARYIPVFYGWKAVYQLLRGLLKSWARMISALVALIAIMHLSSILMYYFTSRLFADSLTGSAFQMLSNLFLSFLNGVQSKDFLLSIYDLQDLQLLILPIGIKMVKFGILHERRRAELEKMQIKKELTELKNQLHPHFVFNVINAAFAEILPVSTRAADYLSKLSAILGFTLYHAPNGMIRLGAELACLRDLIALQSVRFQQQTRIKLFQKGIISEKHRIPALTLVSLLENAIKHGMEANASENYVVMLAVVKGNWLYFDIKNNRSFKDKTSNQNSGSGIGQKNIKRRLQLRYPQSHDLVISQDDKSYRVSLRLDLSS